MILVTGATGNIGRELVPQLLARGASVRVVTRDAAKTASLDRTVERVVGDLHDRDTARRAVAGIDGMFVLGFIADPTRTADRMLIEEAKGAGVKHIAKISTIGTAQNAIGEGHMAQERLIEESGIGWTMLRCGMFMSNALQWVPSVKREGAVYSPFGDGKVAPISPGDIAAVAAAALLAPEGHAGQIYNLTGGEIVSVAQQVAILGEVLGRPLRFVAITPEAAGEGMRKNGMPEFLVAGLVELARVVRAGSAATVSDDVRRVLGRDPESFRAWCTRHKAAFI
jgi:uncharacterized protein YbjT (DUF2867 family)